MRVLILGPKPETIVAIIRDCGDTVVMTDNTIDLVYLQGKRFDAVVCYGYGHLLGKDIVEAYPQRLLNLHISMLPSNRGSNPNFWSFIDDTPKGVTIHLIDEGVDTGQIVAQREVPLMSNMTFRESYDQLEETIELLFAETWSKFRTGDVAFETQPTGGTVHFDNEMTGCGYLLPDGWDTVISKSLEILSSQPLKRKML